MLDFLRLIFTKSISLVATVLISVGLISAPTPLIQPGTNNATSSPQAEIQVNIQEKNSKNEELFHKLENAHKKVNNNEIINESTSTKNIAETNKNKESITKNAENQNQPIAPLDALIKSEQDANQQNIEEVLKDISPEISILFNDRQASYLTPYKGDIGRINYRIFHASECYASSTINECPSFNFNWKGNYSDVKAGNCFVPFDKIETLLFNIKCTNENEYKGHKGSTEKELKIDVIQNQQVIIQPEPEQNNLVNASLSFSPSNLSGIYYLNLNKPLGFQWFGQKAPWGVDIKWRKFRHAFLPV